VVVLGSTGDRELGELGSITSSVVVVARNDEPLGVSTTSSELVLDVDERVVDSVVGSGVGIGVGIGSTIGCSVREVLFGGGRVNSMVEVGASTDVSVGVSASRSASGTSSVRVVKLGPEAPLGSSISLPVLCPSRSVSPSSRSWIRTYPDPSSATIGVVVGSTSIVVVRGVVSMIVVVDGVELGGVVMVVSVVGSKVGISPGVFTSSLSQL
jgi:hypothetical protein